jgi:D-alanyl-D-alanine-carboxypeptidase/D-alanyl-D-alanine-endopeptidase
MAKIHRRSLLAAGPLALLRLPALAQTPAVAWQVPSNAEIDRILTDWIDVKRQGVGIVVGVVDAKGRRIASHGGLDLGDRRLLNGDTVFEIGSQTKVFTSLLLAEAVRHGEVTLDEPVAQLLPATVKVPERAGRQITLVDLATHTSGLPRLPSNLAPKNPLNPYADYTVDQLYAFVSGYTLPRDIGERYEYSNLGAGLLGHALARRSGMDYAALVRARITGPLGMKDTVVALTPALSARMATGHNLALEPVPNWDIPTLVGAGGLHSTTNDILTFLAAELGFKPTPLKAAMDAQFAVSRPTVRPNLKVALGWHVLTGPHGEEIAWHNGGTGGFRTWMGFDRKRRVGVAVMANCTNDLPGDDLGAYVIMGDPLPTMRPGIASRKIVAITAAELAPLVGTYEMAPQVKLIVAQNGARLFAQLTGQRLFEIYPEGPNDFFWKVVDAQVTFQRDSAGQVTGAVLHQQGRDTPARRLAN